MKQKKKDKIDTVLMFKGYYDLIINTVSSMFDWEGLPESIPAEYLEKILLRKGKVAIVPVSGLAKEGRLYPVPDKEKGNIIALKFEYLAPIDVYGEGMNIVATAENGYSWQGSRDDVAIGWNNNIRQHDVNIERFAEMLADTDLSIKFNLLNSRLNPIPVVHDPKDLTLVDEAIDASRDGVINTIISSNLIKELNGQAGVDVLNITDATMADKLQYLTHFHDDLMRWFYSWYGQDIKGTGKMAQQTVDEVNGSTASSFIIPIQMLKQRVKLADRMNELYGTDVSVSFSETWRLSYERFRQEAEMLKEDNLDEGPADAEPEENIIDEKEDEKDGFDEK